MGGQPGGVLHDNDNDDADFVALGLKTHKRVFCLSILGKNEGAGPPGLDFLLLALVVPGQNPGSCCSGGFTLLHLHLTSLNHFCLHHSRADWTQSSLLLSPDLFFSEFASP